MNADLIEVALISGGSAVLGPILLSYLNNRQLLAREMRDNIRHSLVALHVADAAKKADRVAQVAASVAAETKTQLGDIHTLVNNNMTLALQGELRSTRLAMETLNRIISNDIEFGREPSKDDLAEAKICEARLVDLGNLINMR